jgi:hypothetical protein
VQLGARKVPVRVIVARVPAARMRFTLEISRRDDVALPWSLDEAPSDAQIAVNAGQFTDDGTVGVGGAQATGTAAAGSRTIGGSVRGGQRWHRCTGYCN